MLKKQKKVLFLIQVGLVVAAVAITAKPIYHFLKREYLRMKAKERWEQALSSPLKKGKEGGWLSVPDADIDILVLNSSEKDDLLNFPIFVKTSSNLKVIIAHRDIHFAHLGNLQHGDSVTLQLRNSQILSYRVIETETVDKDKLEAHIKNRENQYSLLLVTCYPFNYIGPAPKRYLVWCRK